MARAVTAKSVNTPVTPPAPAASLELRAACASHPGSVRAENQDTFAAAPEHGIYVVCDGMGGAAAGELASQIATQALLDAIASSRGAAPRLQLENAIAAANLTVFERAQKYRALRGMGTTLVAVLIPPVEPHTAPTALIGNVGDSRCYLFRRNRLVQLTHDHSLIEEQIAAGLLSRADAEFSPVRNVITRAIGTQRTVPADLSEQPLQRGDILLLASDGLSRELTDSEIALILIRYAGNLDDACTALITAANQHGGRDNITVILVECDSSRT